MYLGASIGNSYFSGEYTDAIDEVKGIDENSTGWKIFGGYSSASFFGLEGGYRDFGEVENTSNDTTFKSSTKGWDIEAVGKFTVAIVDIFGKAGIMFWDIESTVKTSVDELKVDSTGTDFIWGLGAGVHFGKLGVRLEWESVEASGSDNLSMVSLGATLGF